MARVGGPTLLVTLTGMVWALQAFGGASAGERWVGREAGEGRRGGTESRGR